MRPLDSETVTAATEWSEGHALCPKRVADEPSFELSRDPLVEGPQSPRGDRPQRLPLAVWLLVQRDLGVQNASYARDHQVHTSAVGVPARRPLRKPLASGRLGAPSQGASPSPTHNSYRTTGTDWRAMSTALHSSREPRCCCNAPISRQQAAAGAPYTYLSWTPTLLTQRAGAVSVQIATVPYEAAAQQGSPGIRSARRTSDVSPPTPPGLAVAQYHRGEGT
jgi:hypothetical protein